MPVYEYQCRECTVVFERKLPMAENNLPELDPCPECNTTECVEQIITSAPAIGDPIRLGIKRPDAGWGETLSKIKQAHPKGHWNQQKFVPKTGF